MRAALRRGTRAAPLAAGLLLGLGGMQVAAEPFDPSGGPDPDCWCRDADGERRELGSLSCVTITGRQYLVRCEMSTNTPYWKRVGPGEGCPAT